MARSSDDEDALVRLPVGEPFEGTFAREGEAIRFTVDLVEGEQYLLEAVLDVPGGMFLSARPSDETESFMSDGSAPAFLIEPSDSGRWVVRLAHEGDTARGDFSISIDDSRDWILTEPDDDVARTLEGTDRLNEITAFGGDDLLIGGGGPDILRGGAGNDTLEGGDWDDLLDGGPGADRMQGGLGSDTYIVDHPGDVIVESFESTWWPFTAYDTVETTVDYRLPPEVEGLRGIGTDGLRLSGNADNNSIQGTGGADVILSGGGSSDDDGGEYLEGGAGADIFVLNGPRGFEGTRIGDYEIGTDRLAFNDQHFGLGDSDIDLRRVTWDVFERLMADRTVYFDDYLDGTAGWVRPTDEPFEDELPYLRIQGEITDIALSDVFLF